MHLWDVRESAVQQVPSDLRTVAPTAGARRDQDWLREVIESLVLTAALGTLPLVAPHRFVCFRVKTRLANRAAGTVGFDPNRAFCMLIKSALDLVWDGNRAAATSRGRRLSLVTSGPRKKGPGDSKDQGNLHQLPMGEADNPASWQGKG